MKYPISCPLLLLFGLLILSGACAHLGSGEANSDSTPTDSGDFTADISTEVWQYADSIVKNMDEDALIGQLLMPAVYSRNTPSEISRISNYCRNMKVGGLVLLKGDIEGATAISDSSGTFSPDIPPFIAIDAENGLKMRLEDAPEFPWNRDLGRISDDQLVYDFGREIARECREIGIDMVLGPVVDVIPGNKSHDLMRRRSLGSDPRRVADLALAYARGVEDGNVITVAKHFPGHGSANADSHKALGEISRSREWVDSVDLYPFRRYCEESLSGVMVGHLAVRSLDSIRRPAIVSPVVMKALLREELGFRGLVLTDALSMEGAMGVHAWEAIAAGADMVIAPADTKAEIFEMREALRAGHISHDILRERCRRIIFFKYLLHGNPRLENDKRGKGGRLSANDRQAAGVRMQLCSDF